MLKSSKKIHFLLNKALRSSILLKSSKIAKIKFSIELKHAQLSTFDEKLLKSKKLQKSSHAKIEVSLYPVVY